VKELMLRADVKRSAAYDALKLVDGRYSHMLKKKDDSLIWFQATKSDNEARKSEQQDYLSIQAP
jgi:hypothetical protein